MEKTTRNTTDETEHQEFESISEFMDAAEDGDLSDEFYRDLAQIDNVVAESFKQHEDQYDQTIEVTHTQAASRVRMNISRGTGVRDQDEITGEVKARSPADLLTELPSFTTMLTAQMEELRAFQPDDEDEDDA